VDRDPKVPRPSVEQPRENVERETDEPASTDHEHHGITGPRTAESETNPEGPAIESEPDTGEQLF
jgi:hypothetical protein